MDPNIGHRQREVLCKSSGTIYTDAFRVRAQMAPASQAIAAMAANHVAFTADDLARKEILHIGANLNDFADKLVPDDHRHWDRFFRPVIPFVDVQIGAANAGAIDPYQDIVDSDRWFGDL